MIDVFLFDHLASARFRQRFCEDGSGWVLLLSRDGKTATRLPAGEADALIDDVGSRIGASARLTRRCCYLAIPFAIAICGILWNVPALQRPLDLLDALYPGLSVLLITCGMPLAMIARHSLLVARTLGEVDRRYADAKWRAAPVDARKRRADRGEILAILLVGVGLVAMLVEAAVPGVLAFSPFSGTTTALLMLLAGVVLLLRRRRLDRAEAAQRFSTRGER